nr:hypothetical protein [Acidobacteriota bacterium]
MNVSAQRALTRRTFDAPHPSPPARIAHFGLGSFHRAHQVWFTANASDASDWGICAFTGRGGGIADALGRQDGLYTLIERSATGDRFTVMTNLVEVYEGSDAGAFANHAHRTVLLVTST